jgi:hypothetical protein
MCHRAALTRRRSSKRVAVGRSRGVRIRARIALFDKTVGVYSTARRQTALRTVAGCGSRDEPRMERRRYGGKRRRRE